MQFIIDTRGPNVPLLLKCGHDMCRSCLKFMYKKNKQITCEVCHDVDKKYGHILYKNNYNFIYVFLFLIFLNTTFLVLNMKIKQSIYQYTTI